MIFVCYRCTPGARHPERQRIGEAVVNCWIRAQSFREARAIVRRTLRRNVWTRLRLDEIRRVRRADYDAGTDARGFFDQAVVDGEVYSFYKSPKYPVYRVDFSAVPLASNRRYPMKARADVLYLVVNEHVSDGDPFDRFWDKQKNRRKAIALGRSRIRAEGWRATGVKAASPVSYQSFGRSRLLKKYYDEAEECGDCLAFWTKLGTPAALRATT